MIKFNLKNNRQKGFTLLEALVAISILMVAVSAPITIAQKGLSSAVYSKDQMIASYLAQDVLEYIKNKRDEASINDVNSNWDEVWEDADNSLYLCLQSLGCQIDTVNDVVTAYSETGFLKKDIDDRFYSYGDITHNSENTKFTRKVLIEKENNADQALVTVTVRWNGEADNKNKVEVKTLIFNY